MKKDKQGRQCKEGEHHLAGQQDGPGHAILCSCAACCASRLASARQVFTAQGDVSQAEANHLAGDYDPVDSRQRFELGE